MTMYVKTEQLYVDGSQISNKTVPRPNNELNLHVAFGERCP